MIVADCASSVQKSTLTRKLVTGHMEILKGLTALSSQAPSCPLLLTWSPPLQPFRGSSHTED